MKVILMFFVHFCVAFSLILGTWNNFECEMGPGHWDDVKLAVCLFRAGVDASPYTADNIGREAFWPYDLHSVPEMQPPPLPPTVHFQISSRHY